MLHFASITEPYLYIQEVYKEELSGKGSTFTVIDSSESMKAVWIRNQQEFEGELEQAVRNAHSAAHRFESSFEPAILRVLTAGPTMKTLQVRLIL